MSASDIAKNPLDRRPRRPPPGGGRRRCTIHLAFKHELTYAGEFARAAESDLRAIEAICDISCAEELT